MEKFTLVGETAIRYEDSLKGDKCVVLLHGYMESMEVWEDFAKILRRAGLRTVTLDMPGHGISEVLGEVHTMEFLADTVRCLLDKLEINSCTLVGHSMGGYVGLAFAAKYAERLDGLVLLHSTPNPDSEERRENRMREIEIIDSGRKELLAKTLPGKGFAAENRKRFAEVIDDLSLQVMLTEDDGIKALLRGMAARADMNDMLHGLKTPQLFIFGRKDEYITEAMAQAIIDKQPQAQVAWLENSGHMGFEEEPEKTAEIIINFINR